MYLLGGKSVASVVYTKAQFGSREEDRLQEQQIELESCVKLDRQIAGE